MNDEKIFTPEWLAEQMLLQVGYTGKKVLDMIILDNSCGHGVFLNAALHYVLHEYHTKHKSYAGVDKIIKENIVGVEIDIIKYEKCIALLKQTYEDVTGKEPKFSFSVYNDDFLNLSKLQSFKNTFDLIVGNFPVSKNTGTYPVAYYEGEDLIMKFASWSHGCLKPYGLIYTIMPPLSQVQVHHLKSNFTRVKTKTIKKAIFEDSTEFMLVTLQN